MTYDLVEFWDTYAPLHLKIVGREDKITLLPTWVDVSVEDVGQEGGWLC